MNDENRYCLVNILKVIDVLQKNAEISECPKNSCSRPFLGNIPDIICFNTRLVTFYRCNNEAITLPYTYDGITGTTNIFRIEKVNDDSVVVLLIRDNGDGTYTNTNTYANINMRCICIIQCLGDISLNNV